MPYGVKKQGEKWVKYRTDTGKIISHHDTKEKAEASIRAYYAQKGKKNEAAYGGSYGKCGRCGKDNTDKRLYKDEDEILEYGKCGKCGPENKKKRIYKDLEDLDMMDKLDEKTFQYATIKGGKQKVTSPKQLALLNVKKLPHTAVYKSKSGKTYKVRKNVKEGIDPKGSKNIILNMYGEQEIVKIKMEKYNNGAAACVLLASDGQPFATLSVNVSGISEKLPKGEFFLKDYSENREIVDELIKQGILIPTGEETELPHAIVKSYKVNDKYKSNLFESRLRKYIQKEIKKIIKEAPTGAATVQGAGGITISMTGDQTAADKLNDLTKKDKQVSYQKTKPQEKAGTKKFTAKLKSASGDVAVDVDAKDAKTAETALKDVVKSAGDIKQKPTLSTAIQKENKLRYLIKQQILKEFKKNGDKQ